MSLRRQAIKLAASLPKGEERTAVLNAISAADKEAKGLPPEFLEQQEKMKAKSKDKDDEGDKKGKKASRNFLASFKGSDAKLAREVVKLASRLPEHRSVLLDTLKQAAGEEEDSVPNEGFDPTEISEVEPGGSHEGDSDETYMKDEFTQQEFHELGDKQQAGELPTGSEEQKKYAAAKYAAARKKADASFRKNLIRLATEMPKGSRERRDLLNLLAS